MTHMLSLEEQMTRMKRKPSELPGDQPPPKLLKQTTSTTISTAFEKDSDIDNIPPPVLEKADTFQDERPIAVPYMGKSSDNGSNSSTPPPVLPRFPTLTPTKPISKSDKYFGFEASDDEEDDDDSNNITKLADSICVGDSSDFTQNVPKSENQTATACVGTDTMYDSNGSSDDNEVSLKRADTVCLKGNNGVNGENKKAKLTKKGIVKKVLTPKKSAHSKKESLIKKEKSLILNSLESLRTIQKMPSGTLIEKIMKFGAEEIILPSERSLAVYEYDESRTLTCQGSSINSTSLIQRPSVQVVSDILKSFEDDNSPSTDISTVPKLECVSSEELTSSEISDLEINSTAPTLQKISISSPTKSPKKFIHGGIREIVFSFDTTGSMYSYMEEAKDRMREIVERLKIDIPGVRLAFIAHGDYYDLKNDRYLIKWLDFGATVDEICNFFEYLPITHGGDADECYELALRKVRESLSWTTGSQRCLVMIGDSDPHEPGYQYEEYTNDIDWKEETKKLSEMGVRIYGMQVGYRSDFYRAISQMTGGAHLRIENAELTPDMLMSVCLREGNLKLLKTYEAEVMKRPEYKEGLDLELARLFSSLKNVADNIAMKFKKNLIEGAVEKENEKKAFKRSKDFESPGSKIAKMAKMALEKDGQIKKVIKRKLSPEKGEKMKTKLTSDKIAKNLVKKAIRGTKEKKTAISRNKKIPPVKKSKNTVEKKTKNKVLVKTNKKTPNKKDLKKKQLKQGSGVKKTKAVLGSKLKKTAPKAKQSATNLTAKSLIKAILKSTAKKPLVKPTKKTPLKKTVSSSIKDKKTVSKSVVKNKSMSKLSKVKTDKKGKQASKVNTKGVPKKNIVKSKVKSADTKKRVQKKLSEQKKENLKKKEEKKKTGSKVTKKTDKGGTNKDITEKKKQGRPASSSKKDVAKKSVIKPIKVKKTKDLQPREIASIAKFVTGPLSCLTWEQWAPLIVHEKPKSGNWTKGKGGCPGFCNSDLNKDINLVPPMYEFAVSPPDSSKKYPVYFFAEGGSLWDFQKDKYIQSEIKRVIKSKGSISVRKGTVNKDDDALFLKTIENIKNMFDYAWNSNSSKDTARKQDLVKEGFIVAKV